MPRPYAADIIRSHLVRDLIAQHTDLRHLDFDHVAGLEPDRRVAVDAGTGRRSGPYQVARLECCKRADVVDQPGKAPGETVGAVVLAQVAVDARRQMQRLYRVELVCGHDPGADAARAVEILALRHVERTVAQPVAHAAFVAERDAADPCERTFARDVAPFPADHQHHLALVVELVRDLGPHDRLPAADQRGRKPAEQVGIFRRLPAVLVLGAAVRIIDADADVLVGGKNRWQQLHVLERMIGRSARHGARLRDCLRAEEIEQRRIFRQPAAEIDDAGAGHRAVAGTAVCPETCKSHGFTRWIVSPLPRHGRTCSGHPRLYFRHRQTWMPSDPRACPRSAPICAASQVDSTCGDKRGHDGGCHAAFGAPGWRSGWARAKASFCMHRSVIRRTVGNRARSYLKKLAPVAWLTRQISATVMASP